MGSQSDAMGWGSFFSILMFGGVLYGLASVIAALRGLLNQ